MTDWRQKARRIRSYYAAGIFRFNRGMVIMYQTRSVLATPVYIGMFNLTILNPLGYNIPAKYILYMVPLVPVIVIVYGHIDLKLGITQAEKDYIQRRTDPLLQELRGRIKNAERYLAKRFDGEFKENWEWTDKDKEGGF